MMSLSDLIGGIRPASHELAPAAQERLDALTKPRGSLGRLESIAKNLVCAFGTMDLRIRRKAIFTFAADHGIAEEGVSLYPRSVTGQMVMNFLSGGAAVNVLARRAGAEVYVVDAGVLEPIADPRLNQRRMGPGTKNFMKEDAMTRGEASNSIRSGAAVFLEEYDRAPIDVAGVGEMGIGNSASAAALLSALLRLPPRDIAGRGTGLDDARLAQKIKTITLALEKRNPDPDDPVDVLSKVGGFEIGEMAGCFLAGASKRCAMLVDGFISTAAAVIALRLCPALRDYLLFSHCAAEGGHKKVLRELGVEPILDLQMRLGEGTGAAVAMPVLDAAVAMFMEMATFESARVDDAIRHSRPGSVIPAKAGIQSGAGSSGNPV